ncbi:MAG TPA: hypothetical protein VHV57_15600 [Acidimicrobiales bacterium]|jgi:glutamate synthase domain-containing protein 1|nr:hypothetical protein [Acidimicrobiales bacterium]
MCGVVGLLIRDSALESQLGSLLVPMIDALDERGPDSSGLALYADHGAAGEPGEAEHLRISLGSDAVMNWAFVHDGLVAACGGVFTWSPFGAGVVASLPVALAQEFLHALPAISPDIRVLATGQHVSVLKDTGRPIDTCQRYGVELWQGYMAVAHTRMATESAVTVLHSHPFVPTADLCVVHNGSFSNYATVRRALMTQGITFDSDNDSEVAARFLARRLSLGDDLEEATRWVMKEMDGFFTLVITTAKEMSVVRDAFACKPAVVAETAAYVAVASEYRALAELPDIGSARVFEPQPEEVYTWSR